MDIPALTFPKAAPLQSHGLPALSSVVPKPESPHFVSVTLWIHTPP